MTPPAPPDRPDWSLANRLEGLPLVLAGPIVREVTEQSVTVWVAMKAAYTAVRLSVYEDPEGKRAPVAAGGRDPVRLGENLYLVAVTAAASQPLQAGTVYYYDLDFGGRTLTTRGVVSNASDPAARSAVLAYGGDKLPSFALPPADLARLRVLHGSCRKTHGPGFDAMPTVDHLIGRSRGDVTSGNPWALIRPHLLLLTGDQIYADDVSDVMLALATDAGDVLLGKDWVERLPGAAGNRRPAELAPGSRAQLTLDAGFTSGVPNADTAKSHLLGFGEFAATYLFGWSDTLWPATAPGIGPVEERESTWHMRGAVDRVRRALANVIVYTAHDDHEVTDDWNLNREWCYRVYGDGGARKPSELALRVLTNAMSAMAVFQSWGNVPGRFAADQPGGLLLAAMVERAAAPSDKTAIDKVARLAGVPLGPPPVPSGGRAVAAELPRDPRALRHDYVLTWPGRPFEVIVLDPRTRRGFEAGPLAPPAVLSDAAIEEQIPGGVGPHVTFVVLGGPLLGVPWIEEQQAARADADAVWQDDVEAPGLRPRTFHRLLGRLAKRSHRIIVLSGDVHYGFGILASLWINRPFGDPASLPAPRRVDLVQFTASSFKHQGQGWRSTASLHQDGYEPSPTLGLELGHNPWDWAGWSERLYGQDFSTGKPGSVWQSSLHEAAPARADVTDRGTLLRIYRPEDWRYRLHYLPGARSEPPITITPLQRPPTDAPPEEQLRYQRAAGRAVDTNARNRTGKQIVGVNNLGEISFAPGSDPADIPLQVSQRLYWAVDATGVPAQQTVYAVTLDPTDDSTVPGQVWEARK
ncbi:hypothetical protein SAMN04489712_12146 [Thermomonospora echinospora]|uniref:PhoD-like phosphatase n=1 Tax=Thermomonospora echinospora TaxID=1992 RepID=A0A1H6DTP4_9ACTN|nr:hypothetical protein [Thermomonospora echinospora]SEG87965.1 hypothetical protein SAMN04489712_12146 [Thermomonospora echinospora]